MPSEGLRWRQVGLLLLLGLTALLGWASGAWVPASRLEMAMLRSAVSRAQRLLEPAAPADASRLAGLLAEAETAAAIARQEPPWGQRPGSVAAAAAWDRVVGGSLTAVVAVGRSRREARARWQELEPEVQQALERSTGQLLSPGVDRRQVMQVERAVLGLDVARQRAAAGRFEQAVAEAGIALDRLRQVDAAWWQIHQRFGQTDLLRRWRRWAEEAIADSRGGTRTLVVEKLDRRLSVYQAGRKVAEFTVELGARGLSPKLHAGDRATPEGRYRIVELKQGPQTRFHKALLLDYPNRDDLERYRDRRRRGLIPEGMGVGGLIEIHGEGGRGRDWTDGCVALANRDMDWLFRRVKVGTPVTIVGALNPEVSR